MTTETTRMASASHVASEGEASALPEATKLNLVFWILVTLVFVAGVVLRWTGLNRESLWADEGYTTWFSQFSPAAQWRLMPWETQAPIYHIWLHYWTAIWGTSVTSFRSLSAFFSTLSLGVVFLIARKMWSSRVFAVLGTTFCSVSFFQIWYAQESRSYALLLFFLVSSVYLLQCYLEMPGTVRMIALVAAVAGGLYTHNMALYYLPGLLLFGIVYPSPMDFKDRMKRIAIISGSIILCYVPWLPLLIKQARSVHGYFWASRPTLNDLGYTLCAFCGVDLDVLKRLRYHIPIQRLYGLFGPKFWMILFLSALAICIVSAWTAALAADRRKSIALQAYAILPIVLVFLWSRISTSVYVNRNFIAASALLPLVICAPVAINRGKRKKRFEILAISVLLVAILSVTLHQERKDNWRGVTQYLLNLQEQNRVVFVFQPYCQIIVHYYATAWLKLYPHQPEIRGLVAQFDVPPTGPGILPRLQDADLISPLNDAVNSGRYREIDIALQMERLPQNVQAIPGYLKGHCASIEYAEFQNLAVERCILPVSSNKN